MIPADLREMIDARKAQFQPRFEDQPGEYRELRDEQTRALPDAVMFNGRVVGHSGLTLPKRAGRPPINRAGKGLKSLPPKLREVAELAAKGMLAREIADRTTYTLGSVRVMLITEIYPALGVRNREELAEWWSANVEPVPPMIKGRPTCKEPLPDGSLCGRPSQGRCLCATHYSQHRRAKQRGGCAVKLGTVEARP